MFFLQEPVTLDNITGRDITLAKCKMLLLSAKGQATKLTSEEEEIILCGCG